MKYNADKRWRDIKDAPDSAFPACSAEDVLDRASAWDLPEEIARVVRVYDNELGQVTEHIFTDASKSVKFIKAQIRDGMEVSYYDNHQLHSTYGFVSSMEE